MESVRTSLWLDTSRAEKHPTLEEDVRADVCVVGGGIAGVTAALMLQRAGTSVVLIEADRIGHGVTGFTTAHLSEVIDTRYYELESKFGTEGAQDIAESQRASLDRIASFVKDLHIACDFERVPAYLYSEHRHQVEELQKEAATCARYGLPVTLTSDVPLPFSVKLAARFDDQAQFHPGKYLQALARAFIRAGGRLYEHTRSLSIEDGEPALVETEHGTVKAGDVFVATNAPIANRFFLQTKLFPYRSYVLGVRLASGAAPMPKGLFWDMEHPYHYLRSHPIAGGEMILVGGEDHKTGQEVDTRLPFERLEAFTRARLEVGSIDYRWSAQVIEPVDGLPMIGLNSLSEHVFVASGFSGNGMTNGTLGAMIVSDLILGIENRWTALYDPTRIKPLASVRRFIEENVDFPLHIISDLLVPAEARSIDDVPPGEGMLVKSHGKTLAVYRTDSGDVRALSAVCTHMACLVKWNKAERSWDCPCHGSRFDTEGNVVDGPAISPLAPVSLEAPGDEVRP